MPERDQLSDHSDADDFGIGRFYKVEDANEFIGILRGNRDRLRAENERLKARVFDCPDAEVCKTCPCADENDVCFPGERLRAENERLREALSYFARDDSEYDGRAPWMHITVTRGHAAKLRQLCGAFDDSGETK